jgi:hypothetical protein
MCRLTMSAVSSSRSCGLVTVQLAMDSPPDGDQSFEQRRLAVSWRPCDERGHLGEGAGGPEVMAGIETDRGSWVTGAGHRGLCGVPGKLGAGLPVPGSARSVGCQERRRGCARAG